MRAMLTPSPSRAASTDHPPSKYLTIKQKIRQAESFGCYQYNRRKVIKMVNIEQLTTKT